MKIAYIIADRYISVYGLKGASIHIRETIAAFTSLGHEVFVYAASQGDANSQEIANITEIGPDTVTLDQTELDAGDMRRVKEILSLRLADRIRDHVIEVGKRQKFDFIYERYSLFSQAGVEVSAQLGVPVVMEVNSPLILEQLEYRRLVHLERAREIEKTVFQSAHRVITVSSEVRDYVLTVATEKSHTNSVCVVPNGVDCSRFHPWVLPAKLSIAPESIVVGFVGSLKQWHGLDILLEAFREAFAVMPELHLLIVGEGPMRGWIEGFREGANLTDHITLTGWVDNQRLPTIIKNMHISVAPYPKLDDFYFSPLKLFEYFAMGVPVIASDIGQISQIIEHKKTGLLCEPGNKEELVTNIHSLATNAELRRTISRSAIEVSSAHSWQDNVTSIIESVKPLINCESA